MRDVKVMRVCNKYAIMLTDEEQKQKQKKQNKLKKKGTSRAENNRSLTNKYYFDITPEEMLVNLFSYCRLKVQTL